MDDLDQYRDRIRLLEAEIEEQSRLLGMSGEREAKLLAEVTRLKKALSATDLGAQKCLK